MERIRVLVADDHPVFRYGMRALLSAERYAQKLWIEDLLKDVVYLPFE